MWSCTRCKITKKISDSRNSLYLFYENLCKINTSYVVMPTPKREKKQKRKRVVYHTINFLYKIFKRKNRKKESV